MYFTADLSLKAEEEAEEGYRRVWGRGYPSPAIDALTSRSEAAKSAVVTIPWIVSIRHKDGADVSRFVTSAILGSAIRKVANSALAELPNTRESQDGTN